MENANDDHLIVQVARMYYQIDLTQEQIAEALGLTRQKVSRLLIRARSSGIVQITIIDPHQTDAILIQDLKEKFHLHEVVLINSDGMPGQALRSHLGMAAADYLCERIEPDSTVGIGWGRTLYEMVNSLPERKQTNIHVVPLIGGIGDMSPHFQVNSLTMRLAEILGGSYRFLHIPAFIGDESAYQALIRSQETVSIQEQWKKLDLAVTGVGQLEFQKISSSFFTSHISQTALKEVEAHGAVGDICGRFFDRDGKPLDCDAGVIGIDLSDLRNIPEVIAVAGGIEKVRALIGALRGGYIKTLISDTSTARAILADVNEQGGVYQMQAVEGSTHPVRPRENHQ